MIAWTRVPSGLVGVAASTGAVAAFAARLGPGVAPFHWRVSVDGGRAHAFTRTEDDAKEWAEKKIDHHE